jgi:hypothetical protein
VTGVEPEAVKISKSRPRSQVDFSLCGYIPGPLGFVPNIKADLTWYLNDIFERLPLIGSSWHLRLARTQFLRGYMPYGYVPYALAMALRATAEGLYRPLHGNLDITLLSDAMYAEAAHFIRKRAKPTSAQRRRNRGKLRRILDPYRSPAVERNSAVDNFINYLAREYPRLLDRVALVSAALKVSKSLELYGSGWEKHDAFRPYHKGIVADPGDLIPIFRRSRINLANNTHGLGLHSRTLECMAVGGFIFTHTSPHDTAPGGMLTSFEPGVHYDTYTLGTFEDDAKRWLKDEDGRIQVGLRAAEMIQAKHLWRHRAEQIVNDLRR